MFERFVRLAEAKAALRKGRHEQALELASDPLIRSHRKAEEIRDKALRGLLDRANHRRERGGLSDAMSDVSRILAAQPEFDGARSLKRVLQKEIEAAETSENTARDMFGEARRLVDAGDLAAAEEVCGAAREVHSMPAEDEAVLQLIHGRRDSAAQFAEQAKTALRKREHATARDLIAKARGQSRDVEGLSALAVKVAQGCAADLLPRLRDLQKAGDDAGAYALLSRERALLPELEQVESLHAFAKNTAEYRTAQVRDLLDRGLLEEAVEIFRDFDGRLVAEAAMADLVAAMNSLSRALDLRDHGDFAGAIECLDQAHGHVAHKAFTRASKGLQKEAGQTESVLGEARELAAGGRLVEARQKLTPLLERWPMHEAVRRELEILDQGARDKEQRLAQARTAAKDGRLREASALALSLAVPGVQGEEARLLLKEVQARIDLVQRGLDQVRRAVHGRHSGSEEGLRHCLLRLEQLDAVQTDNDELEQLRVGIAAEADGICLLEAATGDLEAGAARKAAERLEGLAELQGKLIRPDRLDARCLELADRAAGQAEEAATAGKLTRAGVWIAVVEQLAERHADVKSRVEKLRALVDGRQEQAESAAGRGESALDARDLQTAQACLQEAREAWVDGAPVARLAAALGGVNGQRKALEEVEELTANEDYAAAHRRLDHMPPTPPVLRTRIFDIKQSLARAQGLDGGFLLRVDEAGEYLVLRSDSISIGNVRDGKADLAILASIAGRHARISRAMSFHGGMQDRIAAENGELFVGNCKVDEHRLRHGDRVKLGSALQMTYRVPSSRSLTAALTLASGFQVAGTDKILLMRDRGRDGRILIGSSADAHVRTQYDQPEIEIFSLKDGQVRVAFEGKGTIGGRPFRGEHPASPGDVVTCGDVSFVLQPWSKTS